MRLRSSDGLRHHDDGMEKIAADRMAFFTDALMFQPFRIEHDDNANLLVNTVGWLARRPVDSAFRAKFRANLFLAERDLTTIVQED